MHFWPSLESPLLRPSPPYESSFWGGITTHIDGFIIGSAKCSTKWLAQSLRNSGYFHIPGESQGLTQMADDNGHFYNSFFAKEEGANKLTIDYSNTYMLDETLAEKIKRKFGDVPIVLCYRDPVARAVSHYAMDVTYGYYDQAAPDGFRCALLKPRTFSYFDFGLYRRHIIPFLDTFGAEKVMIVDVDSLKVSPHDGLQKIQTFLGADGSQSSPVEGPLNTWSQFRAEYLRDSTGADKPSLTALDRQWLWACYREEHEAFDALTTRLPNVVKS